MIHRLSVEAKFTL